MTIKGEELAMRRAADLLRRRRMERDTMVTISEDSTEDVENLKVRVSALEERVDARIPFTKPPITQWAEGIEERLDAVEGWHHAMPKPPVPAAARLLTLLKKCGRYVPRSTDDGIELAACIALLEKEA